MCVALVRSFEPFRSIASILDTESVTTFTPPPVLVEHVHDLTVPRMGSLPNAALVHSMVPLTSISTHEAPAPKLTVPSHVQTVNSAAHDVVVTATLPLVPQRKSQSQRVKALQVAAVAVY